MAIRAKAAHLGTHRRAGLTEHIWLYGNTTFQRIVIACSPRTLVPKVGLGPRHPWTGPAAAGVVTSRCHPCARFELALRPVPEPNSHHTPTVLTFDVISLPVLSSAKAWMPAHWPTGIVGGIENVRLRTPDAGAICRSLHTLVTSM